MAAEEKLHKKNYKEAEPHCLASSDSEEEEEDGEGSE